MIALNHFLSLAYPQLPSEELFDISQLYMQQLIEPDLPLKRDALLTLIQRIDPLWAELLQAEIEYFAHLNGEIDLSNLRLLKMETHRKHLSQKIEAVFSDALKGHLKHSFKLSFSLGLPEILEVDARDWLNSHKLILGLLPLRFLKITSDEASEGFLKQMPWASTKALLGLDLSGCNLKSDVLIEGLTQAPLTALRWLDLKHNALDISILDFLLATKQLPNLEYLDLSFNGFLSPVSKIFDIDGLPYGYEDTQEADEFCKIHGYKAWLYPSLNPESSYH